MKSKVNIKDLLKEKSYSDKLKDPRWQKKRLEIMQRDDWSCQLCNSNDKTLNVHHLSYSKDPWGVDDDELITVCEGCHKILHGFIDNDYKVDVKTVKCAKAAEDQSYALLFDNAFVMVHDNKISLCGDVFKNNIAKMFKDGRMD